MKKKFLHIGIIVSIILIFTGLFSSCFGNKQDTNADESSEGSKGETRPEKPEQSRGNPFAPGPAQEIINVVKIRQLTKGILNEVLTLGAEVSAINEARIFPETTGTIASVRVEEGERVKKGQILGYIDPSRAGSNFNLSPVEASITGTVSAVLSKVGSTTGPQAPIFVISDLSRLEISAQVPERYAGRINLGITGNFYIFANPDQPFKVRINNFSNVISTQTRTMKTTLGLVKNSDSIKAGMYGTVDLIIETFVGLTVIQEQEIVSELKDGVFSEGVFVVDDPDAEQTTVKFVAIERVVTEDNRVGVQVASLEDVSIVTRGQNVLGSGAKIKISRE